MKILRLFVSVLAILPLFTACQKEYSAENGNSRGALMTDGTGDCMPALVNGRYKKDSILKATNYADIQVTITQTGSYFIKTDTVNGYSFSASGAVSVAGVNTIRLLGSGKPRVNGVDIFTVRYDSSVCNFNVIVTDTIIGGGGTTSAFTLGGSPGVCTGAALSGTYTQGTPTTGSNTATVNVNVTQLGTYAISSGAPVNGVIFSGAGSFTALGANTIILTASGTPASSGPAIYPISAGSSNCSFSVTYGAGTPPATYTINCAGAVAAGTYQQNVATTSANTVTLSATSTGAGSYSVSTNTVNGVSFSGSGTFPSATTQAITLTATGVPTASGPFTYTATAAAGGSNCTFTVTFSGGTPPPPATDTISAFINGVFTTFMTQTSADYNSTVLPGYTVLIISGFKNATSPEEVLFGIGNSSGIFTAGTTYTVNQGPATIVEMNYVDNANIDYLASSDPPNVQNPAFTITITSINAQRVKGTFFGPVLENSGTGTSTITMTNGYFDVAF